MTQLDAFIIRGHEKIIGHYRWLRDARSSAEERARFQRSMDQEEQTLRHYIEQRSRELPQAA